MTHQTTIYINGRPIAVDEKQLTFDEVVALSGMPTGPDIMFTITFRKAHGNKAEGSLVEGGDPVKAQNGTTFSVSPTTRS